MSRSLSFTLLLTGLLLSVNAHAQEKDSTQKIITGIVLDSAEQPIAYASVYAIEKLTEGEAIREGTATSPDGTFRLAYSSAANELLVSCLGYKSHRTALSAIAENAHLRIVLPEDLTEIQSVVVQGKAVRVKNLADGFRVDVRALRESRGNALDLLNGLPNIVVQNEELKVVGKKNIILKIGNTEQRVPASELAQVLKGYDAKLIESVEVLLNPPARYNRDGNTALITLEMIPAFKRYMGGVVGSEGMLGLMNYRYGGYSTLIFNRERFSFFINPAFNRSMTTHREFGMHASQDQRRTTEDTSSGHANAPYLRLGTQYDYSKNGHIGLIANYNGDLYDSKFAPVETFYKTGFQEADAISRAINTHKNTTHKVNVVGYFEQRLSERGAKMWMDASYFTYMGGAKADFSADFQKNGMTSPGYFTYHDDDAVSTHGAASNLDFYIPVLDEGKFIVECGSAFTWNSTLNERNRQQKGLDAQENAFRYEEGILAPYLSGSIRLSTQAQLRAGVRIPITLHRSAERTADSLLAGHYTHYLPFLHLSYSPSQAHRLSLAFNSEITRPGFQKVNPFVWYTSKTSNRAGNPYVRPEMLYRTDLNYTFQGVLTIGARLDFELSKIGDYTLFLPEEQLISTRVENVQNARFLGGTASYYFDRLWWLQSSINLYAGHKVAVSKISTLPPRVEGLSWGGSCYVSFSFNRARTFTGFAMGNFTGRERRATSTVDPQYSLMAGLSYSMLKRSLNVSLACMNIISSPFRGMRDDGTTRFEFDNRYTFPTAYLSISYRFGKVQAKRPRRELSNSQSDNRF